MKHTLLMCIGTRADAIKMCPLYHRLRALEWADVKLVNCGQHKEMTDSVLGFFSVRSDYSLSVMEKDQDPDEVVSRVRARIAEVIKCTSPSLVLVHGDTASALGCALGCADASVPAAHVEAGLRTGDESNPYPEEIYRKRITSLCSYHFAPTNRARENLLREGVSEARIFTVTNTVIDALCYALSLPECACDKVKSINYSRPTVLLTCHRRENLSGGGDSGAVRIFSAVQRLLRELPELQVLFPIHKNGRVRELFFGQNIECGRLTVCEPLDYPSFVYALSRATLVISDSGGVCEEAAYLGVPLMIVRGTTEREEALTLGSAILSGTDSTQIYKRALSLLSDADIRAKYQKPTRAFGSGDASERIAAVLSGIFCSDGKKTDI